MALGTVFLLWAGAQALACGNMGALADQVVVLTSAANADYVKGTLVPRFGKPKLASGQLKPPAEIEKEMRALVARWQNP